MFSVLTILLVVVSLFIILVVLLQSPKGSGTMGSTFGSAASNIIGVQKTGDVMEKSTWGAAVLLLVLAFTTSFFLPKKGGESSKTRVEQSAPAQSAPAPSAPATPLSPNSAPNPLGAPATNPAQ